MSHLASLFLIATLLFSSGLRCDSPAKHSSNPSMSNNCLEIESQLKESSYDRLFVEKGYSLPDGPDSRKCLLQILADDSMDSITRFFAAKLLLEDGSELSLEEGEAVVAAYAEAIAASAYPSGRWLGLTGNLWLVGGSEWTPGSLGMQLVRMESVSMEALFPLLEDDRPLAFEGSEEATLADMHNLRVKDAVAAIIAQQANLELKWSPRSSERDLVIQELQ